MCSEPLGVGKPMLSEGYDGVVVTILVVNTQCTEVIGRKMNQHNATQNTSEAAYKRGNNSKAKLKAKLSPSQRNKIGKNMETDKPDMGLH